MSHENFTSLQRNRRLGPSSSSSSSSSILQQTVLPSMDEQGSIDDDEYDNDDNELQKKQKDIAAYSSQYVLLPTMIPCESMDLLTVGMAGDEIPLTQDENEYHTNVNRNKHRKMEDRIMMYHSITIYRTISWQKLLILSSSMDFSSSYFDTLRQQAFLFDVSSSIITTSTPVGPTAFTWSPQGRFFVVGMSDGSFLLYDLEAYCHEFNKNKNNTASSSVDLTFIYSSSIVTYMGPPPKLLAAHVVEGDYVSTKETNIQRNEDEVDKDKTVGSTMKTRGNTIMTTRSTKSSTLSGQQKRLLRRMGKTPEYTPTRRAASPIQSTITPSTIVSHTSSCTKQNPNTSSSFFVSSSMTDPTKSVPAIVAMTWIRYSSPSVASTVETIHAWNHHEENTDTLNRSSSSSLSCYLDAEAWLWHQRYMDRAPYFLPPSMYHYSRFFYDTIGRRPMGGSGTDRNKNTVTQENTTHVLEDMSTYIVGHHHPVSHNNHHYGSRGEDGEERMAHVDPTLPRGHTILSALCILTANQGIYVYLHARFPILEIPPPWYTISHDTRMADTSLYTNTQPAYILCTSDLSTLVVWKTRVDDSIMQSSSSSSSSSFRTRTTTTTSTSLAHVYTIPRIHQERYPLQIVSAFYSSILSHLSTMKLGMKDVITGWNSALRPLDLKFDPMIKLFKDYGIINHTSSTTTLHPWIQAQTVRLHLLQYILRGHVYTSTGDNNIPITSSPSSIHVSVSNALDHYFTQASMNDALLVRLSKSMASSLAQLETTVRKYFFGPMNALLYDVYELYGYVHYFWSYGSDVTEDEEDETTVSTTSQISSSSSLMNVVHMRELLESTERLRSILEIALQQLIEVRLRVNHIIEWLRGTAAQVKARGTPVDSIQRDHAKKRRVSDSILQHISYFLSLTTPQPTWGSDMNHASITTTGWTEGILGMNWSHFFVLDTIEYIPMNSKHTVQTTSFKAMFEKVLHIKQSLFLHPRQVLSKCVQHYEVIMRKKESYGRPLIVAFHKRSGGYYNRSSRDSDNPTGFIPKLVKPMEMNSTICNQSQWLIIALYFEGSSRCTDYYLEIIALPLDSLLSDQRYYLSSRLSLPPLCKITDLKFYGDDGCGAFKVEHLDTIHDSIQEGRQALGLIVERSLDENHNETDRNINEELWLFEYDSLLFRYFSDEMVLDDNSKWIIHINDADGSEESTSSLRTMCDPLIGKASDHIPPVLVKCTSYNRIEDIFIFIFYLTFTFPFHRMVVYIQRKSFIHIVFPLYRHVHALS